jgi:hypothetical protein
MLIIKKNQPVKHKLKPLYMTNFPAEARCALDRSFPRRRFRKKERTKRIDYKSFELTTFIHVDEKFQLSIYLRAWQARCFNISKLCFSV